MNHRSTVLCLALAGAFLLPMQATAAVIGTNVSAEPLTLKRIEQLPGTAQPAWP